jgi:2-polyprenyl-3-methyl-5-hydroxy-6-metoxy-1,4-benzoquinol methylase
LGVDVKRIFKSETITRLKCKNCGLGFFSPSFPGDDEFYGKLATWDWYYGHAGKSEYVYAKNLIHKGQAIIDVGCGVGEFSSYLPDGVDFTGVELSSKSVEIGNKLGRKVIQLDITKAPNDFLDKFDVVTCFQVLEHVVNIDLFFNSLVGLCKPGGHIVIAVPNNDGFVGDAMNNILNMPPHHILLWNRASLSYLANRYNLEVVDCVNEELSEVHRDWASAVLTNKYIRRLLRIPVRSIGLSFFDRVIYKVSAMIGPWILRIIPKLAHSGHSTIMLLKKDH